MIKNLDAEVHRIRDVILQFHSTKEWLVLDEVPLDAGKRINGSPRIDMLAIKTIKSGRHKPLYRMGYEIKVTRQDFFAELQNPEKRRKAYAVCDEYWFAVPDGLIDRSEVPPECGLIGATPALAVPVCLKMARNLNPGPPDSFFMLDLARRAYQVGRRHGAGTCAFERFDMLMDLAHMLIKDEATTDERKAAINRMAKAISQMQRHPEARALANIAKGSAPTATWFVRGSLQSGRL